MKNIKIFWILALAIALTACEDWLDVNASNQLDRNELFKTETGYGEALTGIYAELCNSALYGRELTFGVLDLCASYYTPGNYSGVYISRWMQYKYGDSTEADAVSYCSSYWEQMWDRLYKQIANLNSLLENIDENQHVFTEDNYNLIKGEALGLRAYLHFDLLRLFAEAYPMGKDKAAIPYVSQLTHLVSPISTQDQVLNLILEDLKNARTLLEKDPMRLGITPASCLASLPSGEASNISKYNIADWHNRRFRFNYYAAVATQARVYLWKGDKTSALQCAQEVIKDQQERFPWVVGANASSDIDRSFATEHIFALNVTQIEKEMDQYIWDGELGLNNQWACKINANDLTNTYENYTADLRYQFWFEQNGSDFLIAKFYQNEGGFRFFQERLPLIRISEMYYIAAECAASVAEGTAYLDAVRSNRALTAQALDSSMSAEELEVEIRKEYKKEFCGEGQLWYYYKRKSHTDFSSYMTDVDYFTFKIPNSETGYR